MQTAKNVTVIPATYHAQTHQPATQKACRRVAGYARVSTDSDEQFTSYEAQVDYYTNFIRSHPDWEFVSVYTDEGVSGLGTRKRDGFNAMIRDALAGKIDLIVTKSVSRFARNTVDSLTTIRKLKEHGTEVYFEKEAIWTFDGKGELLLTIMSSLAQEESRSISENVTWGQRKRMADGKVTIPYKHFLGYERGENKDAPPVVNPEQAEIVKRIYREYKSGKSSWTIAKELTADGIPTPAGKTTWQRSTIESILTNEKYRGSALLQKKITTDFLSKRQKPNEGEAPQYYIEQSHEAIIPPDEWEIVQLEMARRKALGHKYSGNSIFSARLVCADCGEFFGSKVWNSTDKYRRTIWQCNGKYKGEHRCTTPHLEEQYIRDAFVAAFNSLIRRKDELTRNCQFVMDRYTDCADLDAQLSRLEDELTIVTGLIQKWVAENAKTAQDTDAFMAKCREYDDRYRELQSKVEVIEEEKRVRQGRVKRFELFMQALKKQHSELTEFDESTWLAVIDTVLVKPDGKLVFRFANGMEVER